MTPVRYGVTCNRGNCWMSLAPEKLQVWCCTPFPPGQTSPSYGSLQVIELYYHHHHHNQHLPALCDHCNHHHYCHHSIQSHYVIAAFIISFWWLLLYRILCIVPLNYTSYLPLCYHSSKQMDKLKDRKECQFIHYILNSQPSNKSIFPLLCLSTNSPSSIFFLPTLLCLILLNFFKTLFKHNVVLLTGSGSLAHKGNELFFYFLHSIQIVHKEDMSITGFTGYIHQFPIIRVRKSNCKDYIAWEWE